jgi:signal transduction histidine kinase
VGAAPHAPARLLDILSDGGKLRLRQGTDASCREERGRMVQAQCRANRARERRQGGLVARLRRDIGRLEEQLAAALAERARCAEIQRFLDEASRVMASSLDAEALLARLPGLAAEHFGGVCLIDVLRERLHPLVLAPVEPEGGPGLGEIRRHCPCPLCAEVARSGVASLEADFTGERLAALVPAADLRATLQALGARSHLSAPIKAQERVLGVVSILGVSRQLDARDVATAEDFAVRVALALTNAALYREAREAVLEREQLMAVVSHDLRSPLTTVRLGLAQLQRAQAKADGAPLVPRRLPAMLAALDRVSGLLTDLLDFDRLKAGRLRLEKAPVRLGALLREAVEQQRAQAEEKGVALSWDAAGAPDVELVCDRARILQALANLLGNALKFTPAEGSVRLSASLGEGEISVSVVDTGEGIDPAFLPRIFEHYAQQDGSDRRGVGLGLAIASGIVAAHGGRMEITSELGRGTCVRLTLPLV